MILEDGALLYGGRLCVYNIEALKREIMEEANNSVYVMHIRSTKMYHKCTIL